LHSEPFLDETILRIPFWTFLEKKNPRDSILNHFWKRKNLGIAVRIIFGREKNFGKDNYC
jgi:hypothetical protein